MDILIETAIGDAHVSLKGGRNRPSPERQIEIAAAFPASAVPDAKVVAAFIAPLSGLDTTDLDLLAARLPAMPLPSGYRHFRLFDAMTGAEWHRSFVVEEGGFNTLHDVLLGALNHPTLELSVWKRTDWLPDMIPGVLDLEITFSTRPRTKPFRLRL